MRAYSPSACKTRASRIGRTSASTAVRGHFPHGADLVFYQGGSEIARINHDANTCGHLYWVAGDEPGEAWLWWDEDGASDKNEHGDGLCDGGPMEPVALVQAEVRSADSDIGYCTVSASARRCFNAD